MRAKAPLLLSGLISARLVQVDPLLVLYCQFPLEVSTVYAVRATPARVFALEPPVTLSVESLKFRLKRTATLDPDGFVASSRIAGSAADPVATGASLTAVIEWERTTVASEYCDEPPVVPRFTPVAKLTEPLLVSISATLSVGAGPLKFVDGRNRNEEPAGRIVADVDPVTEASSSHPEPLSYCHTPFEAAAVYPTMATPASVLALDPPVTSSAESLKLLPKRLETVAPSGAVVSSSTATRLAVPVAIGASLTAVTDPVRTTVPLEIRVCPPLAETLRLPRVSGVALVSINRTVSDGIEPL